MRRVIGIDLGTTNTMAARDGRACPIGDGAGGVLPSVVAFLPNGRVEVGGTARRRRAIDGPNVIFSSKRILGLRFDDRATREFRERYPLELVRTADGGVAFRTRAGSFTPTDVSAMLLSRVHQRLGRVDRDDQVVVTVPIGFGEPQRRATLTAATRAGLARARLAEEPMAPIQAYRARGHSMRRAAVYDFGGGTFQLSVIDCESDPPRLVAHASDPFLGGDDIDQELARWVTTEVTKQVNWDLANFMGVRLRLLGEVEGAKIALSTENEVLIDLSQVDPECPMSAGGLRLSRRVLDRLSEPLVRRSFVTCDRAMRDAGTSVAEIDTVVFAGGSTHLPIVADMVESYFGRPGLREVEPLEVVALGASLSQP